MTKQCTHCGTDFVVEPEDQAFYDRINVPPPVRCPRCRLTRRLMWRNTKTLYKDSCDLCSKAIVSMYAPEKTLTVYCRECWHSDSWDPMSYGKTYDPARPFLDQYRELLQKVPRIALFQIRNTVDSDYANFTIGGRNLYLTYSAVEDEYCYYSYYIDYSRECFDCFNVTHSEGCYECVDCSKCFRVRFSARTHDSLDSAFLFDCINCQNCFMSSNQRNKQYMIRNQQYTREQYQEEIKKIDWGDVESLKKEYQALTASAIHRFASMIKTVDSTGDNLENCKNAKACFDCHGGENIKYGVRAVKGAKDCYDVLGFASELLYEGVASGFGTYNCKFYTYLDAMRDSEYVDWCMNSANLFGCGGLRKKEYCILNTQYTSEEYKALVEKIKTSMRADKTYGDFVPDSFCFFAYNEGMAQEHFPLSKEQALAKGYRWREPDPYPHKPGGDILACSSCDKVYRIIAAEREYLARFNIPLPKKCPECRHRDRFAQRNPYELYHRPCSNCGKDMTTSYSPDRKERVYCEVCYQTAVL